MHFWLYGQYFKDVGLDVLPLCSGEYLVLLNLVPWEIKFSFNPRLINSTLTAIIIMKNKTYNYTENDLIIASIVKFNNRGFTVILD